ncbi:MAG: hypothetical protein AAB110_00655 [Candidatus Desantisbacteria bacterium]
MPRFDKENDNRSATDRETGLCSFPSHSSVPALLPYYHVFPEYAMGCKRLCLIYAA